MIPSPTLEGFEEILTPDALAFVRDLVREFSPRLGLLLQKRILVHESLRTVTLPDFLDETREIRNSDWKIGPIPPDLRQRRVEITGPVDRKMVINALNSGADVYMADFEDSHSPTWKGTLQGQANLRDAVNRAITYTGPDRREYMLGEKLATLFVRPRGLHLTEKHVQLGSNPTPAFLFDYGLFVYHNAKKLVDRGSGPYIYIPKLESHLEVLLAQTCHKRGAYAIGGMAAQVPIRGDPRSQEAIEKVLTDKKREVAEGYQGAWVAHPGLVPVVMKVFTDRSVESNNGGAIVEVGREDLLKVPEPKISEHAVRANIAVSLRYLESWLGGLGCVAINNLMEDTATVEICRAQIWQWIHHSAKLVEGPTITRRLFRSMLREEKALIREEIGLRASPALEHPLSSADAQGLGDYRLRQRSAPS